MCITRHDNQLWVPQTSVSVVENETPGPTEAGCVPSMFGSFLFLLDGPKHLFSLPIYHICFCVVKLDQSNCLCGNHIQHTTGYCIFYLLYVIQWVLCIYIHMYLHTGWMYKYIYIYKFIQYIYIYTYCNCCSFSMLKFLCRSTTLVSEKKTPLNSANHKRQKPKAKKYKTSNLLT